MNCPPEYQLCAVQGDDEKYRLTFTTDGTTPVDLTGATVTMYVVKSKNALDADALITVAVTSIPSPALGVVSIPLTHDETNLPLGTYFYKIKWVQADTTVKTVIKGTLDIVWSK